MTWFFPQVGDGVRAEVPRAAAPGVRGGKRRGPGQRRAGDRPRRLPRPRRYKQQGRIGLCTASSKSILKLSKYDKRTTPRLLCTGFPKKTPDSQYWIGPDLLSDDREVKIIENIDLKYFGNRRLFWDTLYVRIEVSSISNYREKNLWKKGMKQFFQDILYYWWSVWIIVDFLPVLLYVRMSVTITHVALIHVNGTNDRRWTNNIEILNPTMSSNFSKTIKNSLWYIYLLYQKAFYWNFLFLRPFLY